MQIALEVWNPNVLLRLCLPHCLHTHNINTLYSLCCLPTPPTHDARHRYKLGLTLTDCDTKAKTLKVDTVAPVMRDMSLVLKILISA